MQGHRCRAAGPHSTCGPAITFISAVKSGSLSIQLASPRRGKLKTQATLVVLQTLVPNEVNAAAERMLEGQKKGRETRHLASPTGDSGPLSAERKPEDAGKAFELAAKKAKCKARLPSTEGSREDSGEAFANATRTYIFTQRRTSRSVVAADCLAFTVGDRCCCSAGLPMTDCERCRTRNGIQRFSGGLQCYACGWEPGTPIRAAEPDYRPTFGSRPGKFARASIRTGTA